MRDETNTTFDFHKYAKELSKYSDNIDVYRATTSKRIGKRKIRDMFVFWRNTYSEGNFYLSVFRDAFYLFTLTLLATGIVSLGMGLVMVYILSCVLLGYVSYRFIALPRREKELDDLMSMSRFMTWDMLKQVINNQKELEAIINKRMKRRVKK